MKTKIKFKNFSFMLLAVIIMFSSSIFSVNAYDYTGREGIFDTGKLKLRSSYLVENGRTPEYKLTNRNTGKSEILKIKDKDGVNKILERGTYLIESYNYDDDIEDLTPNGIEFSIPHIDESGKISEVVYIDMKASIDKYKNYVPDINKDETTIYVDEKVNKDKLINNLPENSVLNVRKDIDTSTPGKKIMTITIYFDNGKEKDYDIEINVINKPVKIDDRVDMKDTPKVDKYNRVTFQSDPGKLLGLSSIWLSYGENISYNIKYNDKIEKTPIIFTPRGVEFVGWKQIKGNNIDKVYSNEEVKELKPTTDLTFEAQFRPIIRKGVKFINGYPDKTFKPENNVTRAELVVMLAKITDYDKNSIDSKYKLKYSDVKGDEWYANYLKYFDKYNIISGYPDGTFKPNENVTNKEFYAIIRRLTEDVLKYNDIKWSDDYIKYMNENKFLNNRGINTSLNDKATRQDVVYILDTILNENSKLKLKSEKSFKDIDKSYAKNAILRCAE